MITIFINILNGIQVPVDIPLELNSSQEIKEFLEEKYPNYTFNEKYLYSIEDLDQITPAPILTKTSYTKVYDVGTDNDSRMVPIIFHPETTSKDLMNVASYIENRSQNIGDKIECVNYNDVEYYIHLKKAISYIDEENWDKPLYEMVEDGNKIYMEQTGTGYHTIHICNPLLMEKNVIYTKNKNTLSIFIITS